ncbi:acyltransferase family protein [Terriglobus roseus]|uniref:Peptidoglycan/LPS O-acetylase OafA/YrhL, contains acyltransferase and SGNH-hydrolase domains n=1 Tax=Terriglobus roseus TaxID=392734 RepID=A0A1G7LVR2_9BACT|nr:acyltransferase [Terriglobus roseus]SDF53466.1 Peptidoglycan/LPS O-acetylase OafA/YrhL, contains acyltransferase and SGNH-hydrolase domains [Terriglobus roseus]
MTHNPVAPEESVSTRPEAKPQRREIELDFIRGIAILMVVDFHSSATLLWPFLRLGWTHFGASGVDIFFVLSGFLVGGLLLKEWKVRGSINIKRFLIRRGLKIWPQYYIFLIASLVTGRHTIRFLWGNFLNIQNYTGGIAHTWTLAVEEHAYLLLMVLLFCAASFKLSWRTAFWMLTALAVFSIGRSFWISYLYHVNGYTFTFTRLHGILFGVLLAMLFHFAPETFQRVQNMRSLWFAVIVGTLIYLRFPGHLEWAPPTAVLLADLSGVALFLLLYRNSPNHSWLYRGVAWIGVYSYGIYLWHVSAAASVFSLTHRLWPTHEATTNRILSPIAGILLGIFMTRLIEFPTLALRDKLFPRPVDSAAGIPAIKEPQLAVATPSPE